MLKKPPELYMSTAKAGEMLGVHPKTIANWLDNGKIKGKLTKGKTKAGNRWDIAYSEVIKLLTSLST